MDSGGALLIGAIAGYISVLGFNRIQPALEKRGIHDTCGVHNLHGMPSLFGGVASVFLAAGGNHDRSIYGSSHAVQAVNQGFGILFVVSFAIVTGLITGTVLLKLQPTGDVKHFHDLAWWEVSRDFGLCVSDFVGKENAAPSAGAAQPAQSAAPKAASSSVSSHVADDLDVSPMHGADTAAPAAVPPMVMSTVVSAPFGRRAAPASAPVHEPVRTSEITSTDSFDEDL